MQPLNRHTASYNEGYVRCGLCTEIRQRTLNIEKQPALSDSIPRRGASVAPACERRQAVDDVGGRICHQAAVRLWDARPSGRRARRRRSRFFLLA